MATQAAPGPAGPLPKTQGRVLGYDEFIEAQLRKTRAQVKWTDLCGSLMLLVGGILAYLFAVALVEHWVLPGGLGFWGRLAALAGLVAGTLAYAWKYLLPPLVGRINPVYAAHAIEQTRPTLKNTLVNFLLLRSHQSEVPEPVLRALEQQAATNLSQVQVEAAIDRSRLVRVSAAVLVVVAVVCLYVVLAPKSTLATVRRVVFPWADIAPPTKVAILDVQPGDTSTFFEGFVEIEAVVRGVDDQEPVTIFYSTADGQVVERAIQMHRPEGSYRFQGVLPAETEGLRQDVTYRIVAGDAESGPFQVQVLPAPTISVKQVEYRYPKYTGLDPLVQDHGDLKAIEGTRVTLLAEANQPIEKAHIDLDCDGRRNRVMTASDHAARGTFALRWDRQRQAPEYNSYQLRFTNLDGHENPKPVRHRIEIVRDEPPEVRLASPTEPQIELPVDESLEINVEARDPDFALSRVEVVAERMSQSGDVLLAEPLLDKEHAGAFKGRYVFSPRKLGLKVGDVVRYWAEARDNRQPDDNQPPEPNIAVSDKFKLTIVAATQAEPQGERGRDEPQPGAQQPDQRPQQGAQEPAGAQRGEQPEGQQGDQRQAKPGNNEPEAPRDQPQPGDGEGGPGGQKEGQPAREGAGGAGQQGGSAAEEPGQQQDQRRVDPIANSGDAIEKINEHLQQKQQQEPSGGQPNEKQPQDPAPEPNQEHPPGAERQPGEKNAGEGGQQQKNPQNTNPQNNNPQNGGQQNNPQQNNQPQDGPGQPDQGQQQGAGNSNRSKPQNNSGQGGQPGSESAGGQKGQQNQPQPGDSRPGANQSAGEPQGEPKNGSQQAQPGQPMSGEEKPQGENASGKPQQPGEPAASPDKGSQAGEPKPAAGQGAEVKDANGQRQPGDRPPNENPNLQGGDRENEKGAEGGAGQKATDDKPSPTPQEPNQPRGEKDMRSPDGEENRPKDDEAKSPSGSPKQSDSQGENQGDRSGGGKSGGGQKAEGKQGTGAAGETTASDQGNSQAPGPGDGEAGPKPGQTPAGDQQTGKPNPNQNSGRGSQQKPGDSQPGQGSQPQPNSNSPDGPQPAGESGAGGQGQPQSPPSPNDVSPAQPGQGSGNPGGQRGTPAPEGTPPQGRDKPPPSQPGGDEANLDYARKATDLALEHLKDQLDKNQTDQELLDKLKWTREDMERFVRHWEKMQQEAAQPGPAGDEARQRLQRALEGLGLRPQGSSLRSGSASDAQRGNREFRRTAPPAEYADQVEAYKRGLSRGRE